MVAASGSVLGERTQRRCQFPLVHRTMFVRGVELDCSAQLSNELLNNADITFVWQPTEDQLKVVAGTHLGIAGHVPGCTPHQCARERFTEVADRRDRSLRTCGIHPDLREGEVVIVDQQQVGGLLADQFRHVHTGANQVEFNLLSPLELAVSHVVETECDAMVAKRWRNTIGLLRRFLSQDDANVVAVGVDRYLGLKQVDARGLQPLRGP